MVNEPSVFELSRFNCITNAYWDRDPVCSFLAFWFQIAIETFVFFHHCVGDYVCFTVKIHLQEPFSGRTYVCNLEKYQN